MELAFTDLEEFFENQCVIFCIDTHARILHHNCHRFAHSLDFGQPIGGCDLTAVWRVFDGVGIELVENLVD